MNSRKKLIQFYDNLYRLLDAGIPIFRSLAITKDNMPKDAKEIDSITEELQTGCGLADALTASPLPIGTLDIAMINASEQAGELPEAIKKLSQWHELNERLYRQFKNKLILPIFLFHCTAVLAPLPELILQHRNIVTYLLGVTMILRYIYIPTVLILILKRCNPQLMLQLLGRIPAARETMRSLAIARFCRSFLLLYKAGVPITECIRISVECAGEIYQHLFEQCIESVKSGQAPSEGFSEKLPEEFLLLWKSGEQSGNLDTALEKLDKKYTWDAEYRLKQISQWVPRLIYWAIMLYMAYKVLTGFQFVM